ncbi:MAG: efflux RND transporter permease subunit [Magnetovibrionaceae bacterium]
MNLIRIAIERPTAVLSVVLMVVMFGLVALQTIPIQLTPDVRKPVIQVTTNWPGAAPAEVEREITNVQEEEFKGLEGLSRIESSAQTGRSRTTLEFNIGTDMDKALLLVANRLDRVSSYPDEANEPILASSGADDNPIAWIVLRRMEGNTRPIHTYGDYAEDVIQDALERVAGVSKVNVFGGSARQMEIIVDPARMATYGLTVTDVVSALRSANASVSAGDVDEGKRRYVVRSEGDFENLEDVANVVLRSDVDEQSGAIGRVTLSDIATVTFGFKDPTARIRLLGEPAIAVNAVRDQGANVIEVMEGIRSTIAQLNDGPLQDERLYLKQVYDETVYINSAIDLVQQNIVIGGVLAAFILFLFLRSGGATLVVSLAIPVSVVGSFVAMAAMGRSLNVISLAGIAFAVGMVVDAAIVVLENIYRHREQGLSRAEAAYKGASQVWGAVLVSALTTVMVFIPILLMELEVGQLFRDIAVALSVSVMLSLIVAITVIPALANRLLGEPKTAKAQRLKSEGDGEASPQKAQRRLPVIDDLAGFFVGGVNGFTKRVTTNRFLALVIVMLVCGAAGTATWALLPKLDYLPDGNRNLVFGVIVPPPGYNLETTTQIAGRIEKQISPLWAPDAKPEDNAPEDTALMQRFFFVATPSRTFLGAAAVDPARVQELIPPLQQAAFSEPGTFGLISQRSLFGRGFSGTRVIELNVSGGDLEEILGVALGAVQRLGAALPRSEGTQLRPRPGLELGAPEVRVHPNPVKLADNGVTARQLGDSLDAFNDGLRVAEITVENERIDLMLKGPDWPREETQAINNLKVVTSSGMIVPLASLADVEVTSGPTEIRHLERERTVTLEIRPPAAMPLEEAMDIITSKVIEPLRADGLPDGVRILMSGSADKLTETWDHLSWDLILAVAIVFLVMAVLFESFIYPLVILLAVPLATAGGVLGLALLNQYTLQPLDMLTMLGFIILIGIVVNNAILLVHQTLHHIRNDLMEVEAAIQEATRNRIRPIFMSTLTSVFGMLPLVVFPGAGAELYRGLGSVVLGGLALSAVLTLLIVPPLLSLVTAAVEKGKAKQKASQHDQKADDSGAIPAPGE